MAWSRRQFVGTSVLAALGAVVPRSAASAHVRAEFTELRRNVGIFTARGGTIGWLVNASGAAVVDSQFAETARECIDRLEMRTSLPFEALVNTHHHGDHTGGNGVFRDAVRRIVAHRNVPDLQRSAAASAGTESTQVYAETTFDEEWTVRIGDETVRAKHYGRAHTGGDCTVFFESADIVHLGDLVFNRAYPFIDRPGGASVEGWIGLLERVAAEHSPETIYVFGHGVPAFGVTGSRSDVLLQRDFLSAVLAEAHRSVADGKSREEATALERLPAFPDHVPITDWLTLAAPLGAAYDEVVEGG